jgi:hypothetical protein
MAAVIDFRAAQIFVSSTLATAALMEGGEFLFWNISEHVAGAFSITDFAIASFSNPKALYFVLYFWITLGRHFSAIFVGLGTPGSLSSSDSISSFAILNTLGAWLVLLLFYVAVKTGHVHGIINEAWRQSTILMIIVALAIDAVLCFAWSFNSRKEIKILYRSWSVFSVIEAILLLLFSLFDSGTIHFEFLNLLSRKPYIILVLCVGIGLLDILLNWKRWLAALRV